VAELDGSATRGAVVDGEIGVVDATVVDGEIDVVVGATVVDGEIDVVDGATVVTIEVVGAT
jgi:hypothetical protein